MAEETGLKATGEADAQSEAVEEAARRVAAIMERVRSPFPMTTRMELLAELIDLHEQLLEPRPRAAQEAELAFLLLLEDAPSILENSLFRKFIAEHIEPSDFFRIRWQGAEEVITVAEVLYGFRARSEIPADQVNLYVRELMRHALRQFERQGAHEQSFELLQRTPLPPPMLDDEMTRQRNRVYLFETRRAHGRRRVLRGYLMLELLLVLFVFPYLFVHYENGEFRETVEEVIGVDMPAEPLQRGLTYEDGMYWSIITSASIGYGDVTPQTRGGKMLAAIAGTMGVLTAGVIAGLVLNWITPRSL